jgi:hypothetical protein
MHTIIFGKDAEYLPDGLLARPGGHLILKDGTRYTFDVIEMPNFDAPDRNNNLIEVERLAYGVGKWMLGSESFFESLADVQFRAFTQLNRCRAEQRCPPIQWELFRETVQESHQLWFRGQTDREAAIAERINSEFFGPSYARRWGLARSLRISPDPLFLQRQVRAAAWFEGSVTPLLLQDFSEINAVVTKSSAEPPKEKLTPPEINETLLWHVEQKIMDTLDIGLKAQPTHSQVFIRYCRDRMKLVEMGKKYRWKDRTIKARKAALKLFLRKNFNGLTLEAFFVDNSIFTAAEKQLKELRAKFISRRAVGECEIDQDDELSQ